MVQYGEPVRPVKEVEAVGMEVSPKGETIIDFGQNLAGVLRVKVDLPAGTKLILDHFETKDSQGNYFNNIAGADMTGHTQTDVYISNGKPAEYRPHFTYHGFRYVRVICDAPDNFGQEIRRKRTYENSGNDNARAAHFSSRLCGVCL